jgi:hypothetical protein
MLCAKAEGEHASPKVESEGLTTFDESAQKADLVSSVKPCLIGPTGPKRFNGLLA